MAPWARTLVMLVGLGTWVGVIVAYLAQGKLPDAALLGVPAFLVLALYPPRIGGQGGAGDQVQALPDQPPNAPGGQR